MSPALSNSLGWIGVSAILGAYLLNMFGAVAADELLYAALNTVGASLVALEAFGKRDYQPAVLNMVWMLAGIVALARFFF